MFDNRNDIIEAYKEIGKMIPNKQKVQMLISKFNEAHNNTELLTWSSYAGCGDCQRALKQFWKHIIIEWQKTL